MVKFVENIEEDKQINSIYSLIKKGKDSEEIANELNKSGGNNLKTGLPWQVRDIGSITVKYQLNTEKPKVIKRPPITKAFNGTLVEAETLAAAYSEKVSADNYHQTKAIYQEGKWGGFAFIVALLLCVVLIGILVFIYMMIVKPKGVLVVTYEYREPDKDCPKCAESIKQAATVCRFCGYEF